MELRHYSDTKFEFEDDMEYRRDLNYEDKNRTLKPDGLWVSVVSVDDWPNWCIDSGYGIERLHHSCRITINDMDNILHISTESDLEWFFRKFKIDTGKIFEYIDWTKVKKTFDGIIISPMISELSLSHGFLWYHVWDCTSGCIWNTSIISIDDFKEHDVLDIYESSPYGEDNEPEDYLYSKEWEIHHVEKRIKMLERIKPEYALLCKSIS